MKHNNNYNFEDWHVQLGDTLELSVRGRSLNENSRRLNGMKFFCKDLRVSGLALSGYELIFGGANSKMCSSISESFVIRNARMVLTEKDISSF